MTTDKISNDDRVRESSKAQDLLAIDLAREAQLRSGSSGFDSIRESTANMVASGDLPNFKTSC
ncbi:MAG: hypothetical protein K2X27_21930 [Candidatus Obscuribacterales bacterium]|nr:hypothetical protein [Candidatus Obscuribacterales bacterium]